ncbi:GH36 C-terminal domain-containing protein [Actinosynnema sp. ALI-1.44]|uniref:GH36 C-terminal domain-containing protein n=1 Tax=Actinosynnema sp. ALI-1.44 TaxID=1933779 RepID=UPI002E8E13DC|nr:GH36 C-terminal domain-containing protein [Actinosynnema sp. ALI-1.44]
MVLLWRPTVNFGKPPLPVRLRALNPSARYRSDVDEYSGAVLLHHGLEATLPTGDYASTMLHLTELPQPDQKAARYTTPKPAASRTRSKNPIIHSGRLSTTAHTDLCPPQPEKGRVEPCRRNSIPESTSEATAT